MSKEDYYRKLIIKANSQEDIIKVFENLPSWSYNGTNNDIGVEYHELINNKENAKVSFSCDNSCCITSMSVVPIDMNGDEKTVYRYGYDFSENQATFITDDILFDLCKEINNFKDSIELYCGIIPAIND